MSFESDSITQDQLQHFRAAAEQAWGDDTRHPDFQGDPQPSAGQCYVTARWLQDQLGGHIGNKSGHYFWVSPDKSHVIDLTGDQYAYEPTDPRIAQPLDENDEEWQVPDDHQEWRPGPVVYTRADHPLYKGFRVREYHGDNPRAKAFSQRATHALEHGLTKRAGPSGGGAGMGGDAYPGSTPQAEEDFGQKYFHDSLNDLKLTQEEPETHEYNWFYGNGQLHISPFHNHGELAEHTGVTPDDSGPIAAGVVHVQGGTATWIAESNISIRGLARELEEYGKTVGWKWGGLARGSGELYLDDLGPKKSFWFRFQAGSVQLSESPLHHATGRIVTRGSTAYIPKVSKRVHDGLAEWATDFGYRLAEFPGGGNMEDTIKRKETLELYDRGNPDLGERPVEFDGIPKGRMKCPQCGEEFPDFNAYQMHATEHEESDHSEVEDGHFPTIEKSDEPLQLRPHNSEPIMPLASKRELENFPDFDLYGNLWGYNTDDSRYRFYGGYDHGQLVGYGVVREDRDIPKIVLVHVAAEGKGIGTAITRRILLHYPRIATSAVSPGGERILKKVGMLQVSKDRWVKDAGQEGKDMIQAPIPFVYDVEQDRIEIGAPGQKTADIPGPFTPGGIVEGYYEPGGTINISSKTSIPYTTYHLVQLWYWSHPTLEVTDVEYENTGQKKLKLSSEDVGQYIRTLATTDPAAWRAYQALGAAGGHVYVVGGAVRDALLQRQPKDIDLMVGGLPSQEVNRILRTLTGHVEERVLGSPGKDRGDVKRKHTGIFEYQTHGSNVEIALPRTDDYGEGGRRGDARINVDHELPVEQDLQRRDFTANSMAVDLDTGRLIDPYGGAKDIERGVLRTTHPSSFKEDPTRLLRALTAQSRFGLQPDARTRAEMAESAHYLDHESPDALKQQLDKLIGSSNPAGALRTAQETGVLRHLFPELSENFDYDQRNPHHSFSLGEHSLNVLDNMSRLTDNVPLRLAALLHDVGKPGSAWEDKDGVRHYYPGMLDGKPVGADHATLGANLAESRLRQGFNYPRDAIRKIHYLIDNHMFGNFSSPKGARKFLHQHGEAGEDLLKLRECDNEGKGTDVSHKTPVDQMRNLVDSAQQEGVATNQSALAINGQHLLQLGLKPGPQVGEILRNLTNDVVEDPSLNDEQQLLGRAQEYINGQP